jgi:hypothetical protein
MRVEELTAQVEVVKRLLRYIRRQKTLTQQKLVKGMDTKLGPLLLGEIKGELNSYKSIEALYEKLLIEFTEELDKERAKANE